jgi:UDP-N-acetylmuramoylalanine--D-glutamate ligase
VVAIGEAAGDVVAAAGAGQVVEALTMKDAVRAAEGLARVGDTVLLAPGCTSWDMFASYSERGDAFAAEVRKLNEGRA